MSNKIRGYQTRESSNEIQQQILTVFYEQKPKLTARQIYYTLTVRNVVPKTDKGYRQVLYQLKIMRENNILPFGYLADNTRWSLKPVTDPSLKSALLRWQDSFRKDFWATQPKYVEIWIEKDALAGVISSVTNDFGVPLYVSRGYGSITMIFEAAEFIKSINKPAYIFHFGDFDPSGVDAAFKIRDGLIYHGANIVFKRVAITEKQIIEYNLPQRPTKTQDPRSKNWGQKMSVELDALPAPVLRALVKDHIEDCIDINEWNRAKRIELQEQETLEKVTNSVLDQNFDF